jgi:hypothetical protein
MIPYGAETQAASRIRPCRSSGASVLANLGRSKLAIHQPSATAAAMTASCTRFGGNRR